MWLVPLIVLSWITKIKLEKMAYKAIFAIEGLCFFIVSTLRPSPVVYANPPPSAKWRKKCYWSASNSMCSCICKMGVILDRTASLGFLPPRCITTMPTAPPSASTSALSSVPGGRISIWSRGTAKELHNWRDGGRATPGVEQSWAEQRAAELE
jgi:hypothetical protein